MPRVLVTLDPNRLLPIQPGAQMVEGIADYVPACLAARQALHNPGKEPLELRVHHATVGSWLREWARAYGPDHIQIRTYTARDALQQSWGIEVPQQYEQDILRSGLQNIHVTPREGQSFENVVLEHFYHDFFAYPVFPAEHFARMLNNADPVRWEENAKRPLVARIFRQRLEQWSKVETNEARRTLIQRLSRELPTLQLGFSSYKVLRGYPVELAKKVLGDDADIYRRAQLDPEPLLLENIDLDAATTQIEYYLSEQTPNIIEVEDLAALINQMSGCLLAEFNFVDAVLRAHGEWITPDLIRQIERRFTPLRSGLRSRLSHLRNLIIVERPTEPDSSWGTVEWLDWIANRYMPYHRWLELQRKYDERVAEYAAIFADWYYKNFSDLKHGTPEHFAFSALYNDRQTIIYSDAIALVILLDNFNYAFFPELRRLFNQQDIALEIEHPVLVLPPSATEVGKASLIAVAGDLTSIETKDYGKLVETTWGKLLAEHRKSAVYLASIGELQNLAERKHDLYFLNYLPVDDALHESSQKSGIEPVERVHDLLEKLVESIIEFAHRFQIEKRLRVYVIADHGSTRISKDVVNVLDKKYYRNIADLQHHRYMTISDKQLGELPQAVEAQCYIIDRQRFKTHNNYLAARRYYRFVETNEDFYVHGGLTPEEIVVPFARFTFQPLYVIPPTLRLLQNQFRYLIRSIIEFELGNPNSYPLENISVRLRGVEAEEVLIETLPAKSPMKIAFQTMFKKDPRSINTRELVALLQYECQERMLESVEMNFTVILKGVMETRDDFDL